MQAKQEINSWLCAFIFLKRLSNRTAAARTKQAHVSEVFMEIRRGPWRCRPHQTVSSPEGAHPAFDPQNWRCVSSTSSLPFIKPSPFISLKYKNKLKQQKRSFCFWTFYWIQFSAEMWSTSCGKVQKATHLIPPTPRTSERKRHKAIFCRSKVISTTRGPDMVSRIC